MVRWGGAAISLTGDRDAIERLVAHLPPFLHGDDQGPAEVVVEATVLEDGALFSLELPDGLGCLGSPNDETYRSAASQVELALMALQRRFAVVHAGVVAIQGRALVVPGRSHAGKSTLTRALVDAGATYLSDEYALVGHDGRVSSYPRQLTMRVDGGAGRSRVLPDRSASATSEPLPIGLVAHLTWSDAVWDVAPLGATGVVMSMLANGVNAQGDPAGVLEALTAAADSATALTGTRGDAGGAARRLVAMMEQQTAHPTPGA